MAFARIALFPRAIQEQHEAVVEGLGEAYLNAPGRVLFACGATAEGWQIIQIWETRDQLDQWVQTHLGKAMAHAGGRGYKYPPRITDFELTEAYVQAGAAI